MFIIIARFAAKFNTGILKYTCVSQTDKLQKTWGAMPRLAVCKWIYRNFGVLVMLYPAIFIKNFVQYYLS